MPINFPDFIESHITGVTLDDSLRLIKIYVRSIDHQQFTITISGVDRFVINEMREINIIDSISCWNERSSYRDYSESLIFLITGKQDNSDDHAFSVTVEKAKESICKGEKILLEIFPVYGAQVMALAADVSISDHKKQAVDG
jgi:hypothetical protein